MSDLLFDAESHTYRVGGVVIPSVTQLLSPLYDFRGIPANVLNAKRDLGHAVHAACEFEDQDDLDDSTVHEMVLPYLEAYRAFKRDTRPVIVSNEQRMFSRKYKYAGTVDRRYLIDGKPWTVDIKTTASMSPIVGLQLSAYDRLAAEQLDAPPSKMGALQLKPDGSYKLHPYTATGDFAVFLSLVNIHSWRIKNDLNH